MVSTLKKLLGTGITLLALIGNSQAKATYDPCVPEQGINYSKRSGQNNKEKTNRIEPSRGNPAIPIGIMGFTLFAAMYLASSRSPSNYSPTQRNPENRTKQDN